MITAQKTISESKVIFWFVIVNLPLIAISWYVHYLLVTVNESYGDNAMEYIGLWFLMAFKIIGANLILTGLLLDQKSKKS